MSRLLTKIFAFVLLVSILTAVGVGYQVYRFINHPAGDDTTEIIFTVKNGQTFRRVAKELEAQGLITSERNFRFYARLNSFGSQLKLGEYALRKNMSPKEIMRILASGRSIEYVIAASEGLNIFEIAAIVEHAGVGTAKDFINAVRDTENNNSLLGMPLASLEGYLFPDTYRVTRVAGIPGLIRQMVARFKVQFAKVLEARGVQNQNSIQTQGISLSSHEIVTLASIIEKETGAPDERPLIGSVFYNRMNKKMRLQTDPTVIYGIWLERGVWNRNISKRDLLAPTPYNTYIIGGLPPGPIANPGYEALLAAVRPAVSNFLYFVSRNDGTHVFSKEYSQHQSAVKSFQLNPKAREGKSWRDLQTRPVLERPTQPKKNKTLRR